MSRLGSFRQRPISKKLENVIAGMPDLEYDGGRIKCVRCDTYLTCTSRWKCERHLKGRRHCSANRGKRYSEQLTFDICVTLILCNLSFTLVEQEQFVSFWSKYSDYLLPSRTSVRNVVPCARDYVERRIKAELKNKKVCLCVAETTDCQKRSIVNVMVRKMEPHQSSSSILLASRRIEECTAQVISKVLLSTLEKFEISRDQVLMFITDGSATMLSVGWFLKEQCGNFLHITCKIHALHLVAETIHRCYPQVDALIASTKAVFLKSRKRIREFRRLCPHTPEPPQPILTCWGTWLEAAFYYHKYFESIKKVVLLFNPKEGAAIKTSQKIFEDSQVKSDLQTIYSNYFGVVQAIEKLQNSSLSLEESLQIVEDVHTQLCSVKDAKNECVLIKFESVLDKDSDYATLRQICEGSSTDALSRFKDFFNYANITSVDVERSFSLYKNILSSQRSRFAEITLETHLMLKTFNLASPIFQVREGA